MYEYHYKVMSIIIRIMNFIIFAHKQKNIKSQTVGETSITLPRFTSALTHSWSVISHKNLHENYAHVAGAEEAILRWSGWIIALRENYEF